MRVHQQEKLQAVKHAVLLRVVVHIQHLQCAWRLVTRFVDDGLLACCNCNLVDLGGGHCFGTVKL